MHHIRYFLAVSETLNLTKAAERCNVAQPALTRAIKALEIELGGELLRRERALSHLTQLGERMVPMLRQCYETAITAKMVAASISRGEAAPLSIAISHTVTLSHFTPMLKELSRAYPGLELNLRRGSGSEVAECLKSGRAELAIAGPLGETWSRFDELPLFEEPFGLAVNKRHRLAGRDKVEFQDLASDNLLINVGYEMVKELRTCLQTKGIAETASHQVATVLNPARPTLSKVRGVGVRCRANQEHPFSEATGDLTELPQTGDRHVFLDGLPRIRTYRSDFFGV